MNWEIVNNELLLKSKGALRAVAAATIWQNEKNGGDVLPKLESVGLFRSRTTLSPCCKLAKSNCGSFGELQLYGVARSGKVEVRLDLGRRTDHVVCGAEWIPFDSEAFETARNVIEAKGLPIWQPLTAKQYLVCMRDFVDEPWFVEDYCYDKDCLADDDLAIETAHPTCFTATLSDYQVVGSNWLTMMAEQQTGVILGDGMGLGKTIQAIKAMCDLFERKSDAQVLIICPSALIDNWKREFGKFTNGIDIRTHTGEKRSRDYHQFAEPVVLTTYDIVSRDDFVLRQKRWDMVVLDEAQAIKNPLTKRTRAVKSVPRDMSIAMTGTPFENHMTDLWSIMDFCIEGFLGTQQEFESRYSDDDVSAGNLGYLLKPLMLRRRLEDVPNDLPDMNTVMMPISLTEKEAELYEERKITHRKHSGPLGAIQKLNNELALSRDDPDGISSQKYEFLAEVMEEVSGFGEKIIVFVDKKCAIERIGELYAGTMPVFTLTGSTPQDMRQDVVDQFSAVEGSAMLLCNPAVGGAGLNITAANHVLHFTSEWNPAKIDQADARAYRRGQRKNVTIYYPYYAGTIEEYMWEKVWLKQELADQAVVGHKGQSGKNELIEALSYCPVER